ncbi:uncharacterized protein LOC135485936 isoform X2 [Lineus longissimus]|uniref:uncharacterized protein LOC135485936 isoform X2 n=1 Tax=Lineus longissimus TaxID=88925 RepID=UPI00315D77E0
MSRHRNVRSMNIADEYDYDDVYGHSVEDDYCISPGTAAQFTFNRDSGHNLASFIGQPEIPEEGEGDLESDSEHEVLNDSGNYRRPVLNEFDQARLNSCLEEVRNVVGDSTPEHILVDTIIKTDFNYEVALDTLFNKQENKPTEAPKPQREPRPNRRNKDDDCGEDSDPDISFPTQKVDHGVKPPPGLGKAAKIKISNPPPGFKKIEKNAPPTFKNPNLLTEFFPKSNPCPLLPENRGEISDSICAEGNEGALSVSGAVQSSLAELNTNRDSRENSVDQKQNNRQSKGGTILKLGISGTDLIDASSDSNQMTLSRDQKTLELDIGSSPPVKSGLSLSELAQGVKSSSGKLPVSCNRPLLTSGISLANLAQQQSVNSGIPNLNSTGSSAQNVAAFSSCSTGLGLTSSNTKFISLAALAEEHSGGTQHSGSSLSSGPPRGISLAALAQKHGTTDKPFETTFKGLRLDESGRDDTSDTSTCDSSEKRKAEAKSIPFLKSMQSLKLTPPSSGFSLADLASNHQTSSHGGMMLPSQGMSLADLASQHQTSNSRGMMPSSQAMSLADLASKHQMSNSGGMVHSSPGMSLADLSSRHLTPNLGAKPKDLPGLHLSVSQRTNPTKHARPSPMDVDAPPTDSNLTDSLSGHRPTSQEQIKIPKEILRKPSLFATILCSKSQTRQLTPIEARLFKRDPSHSVFSYTRQTSLKKKVTDSQNDLKPFGFLTPSPDDIVKNRQKAAFTRGKDSAGFNPDFKLDPHPVSARNHDATSSPVRAGNTNAVSDNIARMTFSNGKKKTTTGFEAVVDGGTMQKRSGESEKFHDLSDIVDVPMEAASRSPLSVKKSSSNGVTQKSSSDSVLLTPAKSSSKSKQIERVDIQKELDKRKGGKDLINLVVIGHVDAGKSTLMGHVLYQLGFVGKRAMHKYEQESKKMGKASFAYAWVLDETEEERTRGVTMDVAQTRFQTDTKMVTLLDAPGHKDFIPNMITGAAQADVAILVVNATKGEFETGFEMGGQTREHALLVRSLGVSQIAVAINKMDTVGWDQGRYNEIVKKLGQFLKQAGFKEADLSFVPCSGLNGENLTECKDPVLKSWYSGPTLIQQIDKFRAPDRPMDRPFRMCVADIFKGMGSGFTVTGKIEAGSVQCGDRILAMPIGEPATVKGIALDEEVVPCAVAGDYTSLTITGIDQDRVNVGSILCDVVTPIQATTRIQARVVIFNIDVPLTKGFPVVFHYQTITEQAHIKKLISQLHKSTGEVIKKRPRCLVKNSNAVIEIELSRPICVELYKDYKDLGRFMLRYGGSTIAAGLVTEILPGKSKQTE